MKSEVYNTDCMEYMRTVEDKAFDLCIADPPYWDAEENVSRVRLRGNIQSTLDLGGKPNEEFFKEIQRISKAQIIFGANNYNYPFKGFIVWEKTNIPDDFTLSKCEIASLSDSLLTTSKIFRYPSSKTGVERIHKTQKPVELYAWLLKTFAKEGDKVFDPMLGSGSSRIAAYKLGFDFVGCEIDKEYFDSSRERFNRECLGEVRVGSRLLAKQLNMFE